MALLGAILLYNMHGWLTLAGVLKENVVSNEVHNGFQYVKVDVTMPDPRNVHRFCIQLAFAWIFLFMSFSGSLRIKAWSIAGVVWFMLQATEVYMTGNLFSEDWMDWAILAVLIFFAELFARKEQVQQALTIAWSRFR